MILDTTNFAITHEALHFSKYVPFDKHIINQHIFNGGLTIELDEHFLPRYGFELFEEYAPNLNNLEQVLKSFWFAGQKHYERFASFVSMLTRHQNDKETISSSLHQFSEYMIKQSGEKYALTLYAKTILEHEDRFIEYCLQKQDGISIYSATTTDEYYEAYRNIQNNYAHVIVNRPMLPLDDYIDSLPYTSNHDIVFDFYRKTYTSGHASSRDDLCNHLSLYGWDSTENPGFLSPHIQRGAIGVPPAAQLRKFQDFIDQLIIEKLKETNSSITNENKMSFYEQKYQENLKIFGEKYLFTRMYESLIS